VVSGTPSRQDQEPAGAVDVERMVHRVLRPLHLVDEPDLHPVADGERPVDGGVLVPVCRSMSFQIMFVGFVRRLMSGIRSFHSIPSPAS
jgi:hypothetical protein